ncbi:MAG: rfaE bifunctional protein nucleotidyltransferase chain/domain [Candidatus Latescibacterota bacterium]
MPKNFPKIDLSKVQTYPLSNRPNKVSLASFATPAHGGASFGYFLTSLPDILIGADFRHLIRALSETIRNDKTIAIGIGGHVIKCGLAPVLIDMMKRGWISAIAMNGATAIHDVEIAMQGQTSEDVAEGLKDGSFGMAKDTGEFINDAINTTPNGYGYALGNKLVETNQPHHHNSILATAYELGIPTTVHVALGTDIIQQQPTANGEAIGRASFKDFETFCSIVASLEGGAYLNIGSAVLLPEVFLKALTVARNLGHVVNHFVTANFDMIQHYRPRVNVVQRPTMQGGTGYSFTGHHEIMVPLLAHALAESLDDRVQASDNKILTREQAINVRNRLREIGTKTVFTNGCFDLLHRGHVTYLQKAREQGDVLFLGLNTDASVQRLKGPNRPILPLEDRAGVLAALECIDHIIPFDEDTPQELIAALLPDVLIKGGDYQIQDIVGREEVEAAGGTVTTIPLVEGRSTTNIVEKIKGINA